MPLSTGKTKEARQENIKKEIAAGKDPKQAVAIGYAKQRENAKDGLTPLKRLKATVERITTKIC
jgi:hypothetical protein